MSDGKTSNCRNVEAAGKVVAANFFELTVPFEPKIPFWDSLLARMRCGSVNQPQVSDFNKVSDPPVASFGL